MNEQVQFSMFAQEDTQKLLEDTLAQNQILENQLAQAAHDLVSREKHFNAVQQDYDRLHAEIAIYKRALRAIRWRAEQIARKQLEPEQAQSIVTLCDYPENAKREVDE